MKKDNSKIIGKLIVYSCFVIVLSISIFFSSWFEVLLMLKPDFDKVSGDSFQVHFLDAGDGDAILVRFSTGKTMIVDSGTPDSKSKVMSYIDNVFFANSREKVFDFAVLTHSDIDHCGNMLEILNTYKVNTFIRPQIYAGGLESGVAEGMSFFETNNTYAQIIAKLASLSKSGLTKVEFASFDTYYFTGIKSGIHLLSPVKNYYTSTNEYSPIMVVYDNETKVMLTGDATIDNELEVINNYDRDELDADILKLGHHGSNTSTSLEFLNAVNPKYAVVSANKKNDNHPNSVVLENIMEYNNHSQNDIELKQTSSLGNIIFYTNDGENIEMLNIANVDDYLFLSWWVVVLSFAVIVGISMFSTDFVALIFSRHKTAVKY